MKKAFLFAVLSVGFTHGVGAQADASSNTWPLSPGHYSGTGTSVYTSRTNGGPIDCQYTVAIDSEPVDGNNIKFSQLETYSPNSACGLSSYSNFYVSFDGQNYGFFANGYNYPNEAKCIGQNYCTAAIFYNYGTTRVTYQRNGDAVEVYGLFDFKEKGVQGMWHYTVKRQ